MPIRDIGRNLMLIRKVERFLRDTGMASTQFGRLSVRDPGFVRDLRNGRVPRERTASRAEHFMNTFRENCHAN